ncbi:Uncharacterised protein [Mycobacteroides abscessus subsp. massiliense]|nr:Uncharacterised protein [Mycobacteroides abscessus subsp. massiliense]
MLRGNEVVMIAGAARELAQARRDCFTSVVHALS